MNWNINWNIDLSWWHKQFVFLTNTNECNQFIHTMQAMNKAFLLLCGSCLNEIFQMWNYYHCSAGHHCFLVCIYVKKSYCSFCDEKKESGFLKFHYERYIPNSGEVHHIFLPSFTVMKLCLFKSFAIQDDNQSIMPPKYKKLMNLEYCSQCTVIRWRQLEWHQQRLE